MATLLSTVLVGACGGGPDRREQVDQYLRDANRVQAGWSGSFKRANEAYLAFSRSELSGDEAVTALDAAEADIRAARVALGRLQPPDDAKPLHTKLLQLFDMNIDFADQTAQLAAYVPAAEQALVPLDRVNRGLQRDLRSADDAHAQARALQRFSGRLGAILRDLRAVHAPTVLRVSHGDQVRALSRTRSYSGQLRDALVDADAKRVARLLELFRERRTTSAARKRLARKAIAQYNRRYEQLNEAYIDVRREEGRLDRAFA